MAICLFVIATTNSLAAQQSSHALFNGKDLDGWQQVGPGSFVVTDGTMKTEGGMGMLWYTREKVAHATIRVVFKLSAKESDSGVFIRIPDKPTEPWMPINRGYEVEIGDWPDDYSCTGVLYTFTRALARPIKPIGEWNTMDITIDGPRTIVYLNSIKTTDLQRDSLCRRNLLALMIRIEGRVQTPVSLACRIIRGPRFTSGKCRSCPCRSDRSRRYFRGLGQSNRC